jgi:hypothetical protein
LSLRFLQIGRYVPLNNWVSNTPEKLKCLYPPNPWTYIDVTLTWRWHTHDLILTWGLCLRLLQIGIYVPLKNWLSNYLEKLKCLYPANPWTYIDVTQTWSWHIRDLILIWVLSLRFLQIARYMPLKIEFRKTLKIKISLYSKPLYLHLRDSDKTMTYTLPQSDISFISQIPTDREIYAFE